jgi:hypothetical protein
VTLDAANDLDVGKGFARPHVGHGVTEGVVLV